MKKSVAITLIVVAVLAVGGVLLATKKKDSTMDNHNMANTGSSNSGSKPAEQTAPDQINIKDFAFAPKTMTIKKGTKITWTNKDSAHHDITPDQESADFMASKLLAQGESYSFTFEKAGTYAYHCSPHPYMKASIEVTE